jgi:hypothetical protein
MRLLLERMGEHGDLEVTIFDDETCAYYPVEAVLVTKDFGKPTDIMVLEEAA